MVNERVAQTSGRTLRADCDRCVGLCCVALPFSASADFAIDKPAGSPCPHLAPDSRCGIHSRLRESGFAGCTSYDCFGAGQQVSQVTFGGQHWRLGPHVAEQMFDVFPVMRHLHELLWYLTEALSLPRARALHGELGAARGEIESLTGGSPAALLAVDVAAVRKVIDAVLARSSELERTVVAQRQDRSGADLLGADLRGADLHGANLRGTCLIAADLRGADLRLADLLGADLRAADLRGADLDGALFLIQSQLDAAKGDRDTKVPSSLMRPPHW